MIVPAMPVGRAAEVPFRDRRAPDLPADRLDTKQQPGVRRSRPTRADFGRLAVTRLQGRPLPMLLNAPAEGQPWSCVRSSGRYGLNQHGRMTSSAPFRL